MPTSQRHSARGLHEPQGRAWGSTVRRRITGRREIGIVVPHCEQRSCAPLRQRQPSVMDHLAALGAAPCLPSSDRVPNKPGCQLCMQVTRATRAADGRSYRFALFYLCPRCTPPSVIGLGPSAVVPARAVQSPDHPLVAGGTHSASPLLL